MTDLRLLLASNIKFLRNTQGLSQEKLAERADTATNYIAAIEAGRRFPSVKMLEKIAAALKTDTPELFIKKHILFDKTTNDLQEQVWTDIGQDLSKYISKYTLKKIKDLKRQKK